MLLLQRIRVGQVQNYHSIIVNIIYHGVYSRALQMTWEGEQFINTADWNEHSHILIFNLLPMDLLSMEAR